jgi:hypothetical protein
LALRKGRLPKQGFRERRSQTGVWERGEGEFGIGKIATIGDFAGQGVLCIPAMCRMIIRRETIYYGTESDNP